MQGLKGAVVIVAILGMTAVLGACRHMDMEPMKLGAADVVVEQGGK